LFIEWIGRVSVLNLLRRGWGLGGESSDAETRRAPVISEVEYLEPRLCLGGIVAAGTAGAAIELDTPNAHADHGHFESQQVVSTSIRYDFRDHNGDRNLISSEQILIAQDALEAWSHASGDQITFVRDTTAPIGEILNIGVGSLESFGHSTGLGGVLGVGGGRLSMDEDQGPVVSGVAWLDRSEGWDHEIGSGGGLGTRDFGAVMAHEIGHALGYDHIAHTDLPTIMAPNYSPDLPAAAITGTAQDPIVAGLGFSEVSADEEIKVQALPAQIQLTAAEVEQLLRRASAATASEDAIIAVVDRGGSILGVLTEDGVTASTDQELSFKIDGAVAKARTAAFFSNGDPANGTLAPLTSRLVRFISQSTITQREVESDPNATDATRRGPGLVAPIGVGGHFPPEIAHTPPVDLFAIEQTNRDSITDAGGLSARFDATFAAGQEVMAPESYGFVSGLAVDQQARGIATLPGGIPLYRDSDCDGVGDTLVGGIGVFFPGSDGFATHEQGFVAGIGQTELERTNASRVLEAEYIAYAATGGSTIAETFGTGAPGARIGALDGVGRVDDLDLPFGVLTLVGITLQVVGPTAGIEGVRSILDTGQSLGPGVVNGTFHQVDAAPGVLFKDGTAVPQDWLVNPTNGNGITAAEVESIIDRGIQAADRVRAAVRLPRSSPTRMVFSVTDLDGEVVGLYRMPDSTFFSIDVAVAKARNVAYYAGTNVEPEDRVPGVASEVAFSNRTFRFLAEGRFPDGVEASQPGPFSILNEPSINSRTAENIGAPAPATDFDDTVLGHNSFNPSTNFHDTTTSARHQNGVVFFPGSTPLYRNGTLIGGFGVSGDGVDQDDVVTFLAARDFLPDSSITRADQTSVDGVRLPYMKFLRNPFRDVRR